MARRRGRAVAVVVAVLLLGNGVWLFRDHIPGPWKREDPAATQVSPEAADQAQEKLERLRTDGDTVRLNGVEFTSLLRYRMQGLAGPLDAPAVAFEDSTMRLTGRFPTDKLPDSRDLDQVRGFLPDTADVAVKGTIRTIAPGRAAVRVETVSFARFPVPERMYPEALARMGRTDQPGLEPNEYPFPLPPGVGAARVEAGQLVLAPAK